MKWGGRKEEMEGVGEGVRRVETGGDSGENAKRGGESASSSEL